MLEKARLIPCDVLPEEDRVNGRKGRGIWVIALNDFMASGAQLCRVETIKEHKAAVNGLYAAIRRTGLAEQVSVMTRNGRVYLARIDKE